MSWHPSAGDVAARLPARFHGQEPSELTVPTASQITAVVNDRVAELRIRCGDVDAAVDAVDEPRASQVEAYAKETVTIGAAAYIESAFFPEQHGADTSAAIFLRMRYEEHLAHLRRQVHTVWYARRTAPEPGDFDEQE